MTATVSWVAAAFGANWIVPTSPVGLMFTSELRFVVPVSGFILNDIRLRSEDAVAFVLSDQNATITPIAGTNNYLISIDASGEITGSALYSFRLRARSVTYDGLAYPAATIDSPEFTIDDTIGQIATFTITTPTATAVSGVPIVFSIASNIVVNGLTDSDITVVGGTAEPIQGSGSAYTVRVTPDSGSGILTLTIAENAVDEMNNETSLSVNYSPAVVPEAVMIVSITETSANIGDVVVVNVSSNIPVNGLTIDDFTTTRGTLSNFQNLGNNMYSLDLTLPSTGSGNARVRLAAGSVDEGNNAATDVVAYSTPTFFIDPIADQVFTAGVDFELPINITGDPDHAYIESEWLKFYTDFDNPMLKFKGMIDAEFGIKEGTVIAVKGSQTITRAFNYMAILAAPVIGSIPINLQLPTKIPFEIEIPIANNPSSVRVEGLLAGFGYSKSENGVKLLADGEVPDDADLTVESGNLTIYTQNSGGADTRSGTFDLVEFAGLLIYALQTNPRRIHVFTAVTIEGTESLYAKFGNLPPSPSGSYGLISIHGDYIYLYNSNSTIHRLPLDFNDMDNLSIERSFPNNAVESNIVSFVMGDNEVCYDFKNAVSSGGFITRVPIFSRYPINISSYSMSGGFATNQFGFPRLSYASIYDDKMYTLDENQTSINVNRRQLMNVYEFDPLSTTHQSLIRSFFLSEAGVGQSGTYSAMAVDENYVYCFSPFGVEGHHIDVYDRDTQDGEEAALVRSFTVAFADSSSNAHSKFLMINGNNLYLLEFGSGELILKIVSKNTADGQEASVIRSFTVADSTAGGAGGQNWSGDIYNGSIYLSSGQIVDEYDENTPNNTTAVRIRRFRGPTIQFVRNGTRGISIYLMVL